MGALLESYLALETASVESAALPVCLPPWRENRYRLVSLWNMIQLRADELVFGCGCLMKYWVGLRNGGTLDDFGSRELGTVLGALEYECKKHGFRSSLSQISRIRGYIEHHTLPGEPLGELALRIHEELQAEMFLHVPIDRVRYYESTEPLFGTDVAKQFPSISFDVVEAGKCYALHRSTACVFHLMRVLEIGLSVFAARFNVPSNHTNWHNVIEGIEKAIRNMSSDLNRPVDWKDQQEFFSQVASHFMLVKDAWRNYTAHARGKYTEDEAETMLINVRGFMQKLATRLHE